MLRCTCSIHGVCLRVHVFMGGCCADRNICTYWSSKMGSESVFRLKTQSISILNLGSFEPVGSFELVWVWLKLVCVLYENMTLRTWTPSCKIIQPKRVHPPLVTHITSSPKLKKLHSSRPRPTPREQQSEMCVHLKVPNFSTNTETTPHSAGERTERSASGRRSPLSRTRDLLRHRWHLRWSRARETESQATK